MQSVSQASRKPEALSGQLIDRAIEHSKTEGRHNACFGMALQFRDNRFTQAEAESAAETYAKTVGGRDYSRREALSAVRSAYRRPAREPWGSNRQWSGSRQPRREITGDDFDRMLARGIAEVAYQIQPIRPVLVPQSVARFCICGPTPVECMLAPLRRSYKRLTPCCVTFARGNSVQGPFPCEMSTDRSGRV
jgi:hypothetical protein